MNEQLVGLVPSMYVCQDQTAAYARRIALSSELLYIAACWKNVEKSIMVTSTSICNATLTSLPSRNLCWASTCRFCTSLEKTPGTGCCFNILWIFPLSESDVRTWTPQRIQYLPARGGDKAVAEMFLPLRSIVENRASWTFLRNHPKKQTMFRVQCGLSNWGGNLGCFGAYDGGGGSNRVQWERLNCNKKLGDWAGQVFFLSSQGLCIFRCFTCFKVKHVHTFWWFWTLTMAINIVTCGLPSCCLFNGSTCQECW